MIDTAGALEAATQLGNDMRYRAWARLHRAQIALILGTISGKFGAEQSEARRSPIAWEEGVLDGCYNCCPDPDKPNFLQDGIQALADAR